MMKGVYMILHEVSLKPRSDRKCPIRNKLSQYSYAKYARPINNWVFAYILINIRLCFYWPTTFLEEFHMPYSFDPRESIKAFVKRNTIITYLFANKKQFLSDFWNVLSAAATTRFFIVSTSVVSVLVITGNVLVQLSHLKKEEEGPPEQSTAWR